MAQPPEHPPRGGARSRAGWPVLLVGIALGGLLDGIVLHQVLQWHHLVVSLRDADDLAGLEHNTLWDGVFHLATWVVLVVALLAAVLGREGLRDRPVRWFVGEALMGWGLFHLLDQAVFHLALDAHHIRMVPSYQLYDWVFTGLGLALLLLGRALARRAQAVAATA